MPPKNFNFPPPHWQVPSRSCSDSVSSDVNSQRTQESYPNPMMQQQFPFGQAGNTNSLKRPQNLNQDPVSSTPPIPPMRTSTSVFNLNQKPPVQASFQQNPWGFHPNPMQQVIYY